MSSRTQRLRSPNAHRERTSSRAPRSRRQMCAVARRAPVVARARGAGSSPRGGRPIFLGFCREPSDGIEPSTPSVPCAPIGNGSQPVATVLACLSLFGSERFATGCHCLRPLCSINAPSSAPRLCREVGLRCPAGAAPNLESVRQRGGRLARLTGALLSWYLDTEVSGDG